MHNNDIKATVHQKLQTYCYNQDNTKYQCWALQEDDQGTQMEPLIWTLRIITWSLIFTLLAVTEHLLVISPIILWL